MSLNPYDLSIRLLLLLLLLDSSVSWMLTFTSVWLEQNIKDVPKVIP